MTTPDATAEVPRRLTRSRDGRIVAGVCDGAARYFDIDPVIFRVVLAVLAIFGGAGLVIYALAWLLVPEDGAPATRLERWLDGHGDRRRDLLIVAVGVFVVIFLTNDNPFTHRIGGAFFVIVFGFTIAALLGRRRFERRPRSSPAPTATAVPYGPMPDPAAAPTAVWTPPVAARRPRSWLGWLTIGTTMLLAGALGVVAFSGAAHPQPADVLAGCVGVVGVGVLVGSFYGRAWSMIPVGLLLVAALAAADALPRNLTWTAGNRTWVAVGSAPHAPYVLGAGDATLDLTKLPARSVDTIDSRIGAGRLIVLVPTGMGVTVDVHASAGRILIFGREDNGSGVHAHRVVAATSPRAPTVSLDLQMGFGDVEVRHAAA